VSFPTLAIVVENLAAVVATGVVDDYLCAILKGDVANVVAKIPPTRKVSVAPTAAFMASHGFGVQKIFVADFAMCVVGLPTSVIGAWV